MLFSFLKALEKEVTQEEFKTILAATTADIKFNNVFFGKRTSCKEFIIRCLLCKKVVIKNA
ncbi:MAG: hypothetical protein ACI4WU_04960 [Bacilli bacterium]